MKKIIFLFSLLVSLGKAAWSQQNLFTEVIPGEVINRSIREQNVLDQFTRNPLVDEISFIKIDVRIFDQESISINSRDISTIAKNKEREIRDENINNFSWFGRLTDETGIFFSVINKEVASKFYLNNIPCLIIPFRDDVHLLIKYKKEIDNAVCGASFKPAKDFNSPQNGEGGEEIEVDNGCTMRVLWVVTAQAEPEIPISLALAAQMLQDETNLAYQQSQISYRMEMARVVRTTYVETTNNTNATAYGQTFSFPSDLINLSTGAGLLSNIPVLRNLYNADVVVMVRSEATNTAQGFYGVAYGIPTGGYSINPNNAFAIISTQYMIGGRFTYAHEIGHIQGARHDNHPESPTYARGYIFSTASNNNRTIMAVGGSCNPPTGCRVQFFSNPNVTYNGIPVGIANQRDNARRINETATQALNLRQTSVNLLLPAETLDNEILARHLATQTISTNNSSVIALNGSRLSMRAGTDIALLPGFQADAGSEVSVYINSCGYVPTNNRGISNSSKGNIQANKSGFVDTKFKGIRVFPNPASKSFTIVSEYDLKNAVIQVFDMNGRLQMSFIPGANGQQVEVNTEGLVNGLYVIKVITKSKTSFIKISIQRSL